MNCIIANSNIKIFVKVLQALSKVGIELVMEAYPDKLLLRCVNSRSTGFAICKIEPTFFEEFDLTNGADENGPFICKMLIKPVVGVFKNLKQLEKQIELCTMECEPDSTNLTFKMQYKCKACKTHKIYLSDGEFLQVTTPDDDRPNVITSVTAPFVQILTNFQSTDEEITFNIAPDSVMVRNYTSLDPIVSRFVRTQYKLDTAEFDTYNVSDTCNITFQMKPFRACIQLADYVHVPVTMSFQKPGVPLVINYSKSTLFNVAFTFATLSRPDEDRPLLNVIRLGTSLSINFKKQPENVRQNSSLKSSNDLSILSLSGLTSKKSPSISNNKAPTKATTNESKKRSSNEVPIPSQAEETGQVSKVHKSTERKTLRLRRPEEATKKLKPFDLPACTSKESDCKTKTENEVFKKLKPYERPENTRKESGSKTNIEGAMFKKLKPFELPSDKPKENDEKSRNEIEFRKIKLRLAGPPKANNSKLTVSAIEGELTTEMKAEIEAYRKKMEFKNTYYTKCLGSPPNRESWFSTEMPIEMLSQSQTNNVTGTQTTDVSNFSFKKKEPTAKKNVKNAGETSVVSAVNEESDSSEHSPDMSLPLLKKQKTKKSDNSFSPIADKNKNYEPKPKWRYRKRIEKKATVRDDNEPQPEHGHNELGPSSEIPMSDYVQKPNTINPPAERQDSTFCEGKFMKRKSLKQVLATCSPDMPLVVPSSIPEDSPSQNVSNNDTNSSANVPLSHEVNRKQETTVRPIEKPVNNLNLVSANEKFNEYPPWRRRVVPITELKETSFGVTAESRQTEEEKAAELKKKDDYIKRIFACLFESPPKKAKIILCPDTSSDEDD